MSDTPTPTTVAQPNYPTTTAGSTSSKVDAIVGTPAPAGTTDIQSPGVPQGAATKSGRPPKKVVDENGNVTYVFYEPTADANFILSTMDPKTRDNTLRLLYEHGAYGGQKRGNGLNTQDIGAFADLLYYANPNGVPWEQALTQYTREFAKDPSRVSGAGRRPPIEVSNSDDIKTVFKRTAQTLLGRAVDEKIADAFVASVQAEQRAQQQQAATQSGGVIEQMPNIETMAAKKIEDRFAVEQRVQNAANAASIIDTMVKGLAR